MFGPQSNPEETIIRDSVESVDPSFRVLLVKGRCAKIVYIVVFRLERNLSFPTFCVCL